MPPDSRLRATDAPIIDVEHTPALNWSFLRPIHVKRSDADSFSIVVQALAAVSNDAVFSGVNVAPSALVPWHSPDERHTIRGRILTYLLLQSDWGEPGSVAPTRAAVDDALRFLDLVPADCMLPHVAPAGDGEINFCWETDEVFVDVGFYGNGRIEYYVRADKIGVDREDSEVFSGGSLPRAVLVTIPTSP